ncbi:TetR/AcrR family transcriptional regulator [Pseudomonas sp. R5(2019)]|uniref:TetR/AcrR family transcriptional regulator n=1 Tax=Pseudomonas sp. R5(2019) TaxID=2697566 RepID=UPI001412532F|nr:TetR/AcrR family transcriptional regulator [Pseudomonas sp. R5(2019)]NBA97127.1 TetR family transcriptional regulator [Pseudomonas sp. R5(2019)]
MRTLTPSAERICLIAVEHFAEHGYDASSLNEIAGAAGMRKASLYAHFTSKDDLFAAVFERALAAEYQYVEQCFAQAGRACGVPGQLHSERLSERYECSSNLRFLLRTAFFPPAELRPAISRGFEAYLERMGELFRAALRAQSVDMDESRLTLFSDAYLGIIDSLHVELFYAGPESYARRLRALWYIFAQSLENPTL